MTNPCLVVLHPRRIPEVVTALAQLPIAQCHLVAMTEWTIAQRWPEVLAGAQQRGHTHLILVSDDGLVTPGALHAVLEAGLAGAYDRVVTGWSNLDGDNLHVNLSDAPLTGTEPTADSYTMPTVWDILSGPRLRTTYFAGLCLTLAPLQVWTDYPFQVYGEQGRSWGSDFSLSLRLGQDGIPITAVRDAFVHHLKARWSQHDPTPGRELLIGQIPEEVRWCSPTSSRTSSSAS